MFILDSNRFARDRAALSGEVEAMITAAGGEVLVSRLWEERRLAYAIGSHRKGTYWLIYFRGPSSMVEPLNRQSELHESILRHLVLKIHPHLVDVMLEHAKAGPAPPAAAPPAATSRDRRVPDMTVDAAADN
jgi:small subunit ribosomal protein S6